MKNTALVAGFLLLSLGISAQAPLPPLMPWKGKSEQMMRSEKDRLQTPFEKSEGQNSATLQEVEEWFSKLMLQFPVVQKERIGTTALNRDIWMYSIRKAGKNKPTFLFQAGIHAGEIDGKDAGMLFFREVLEKRAEALENVNVLFIPVLNVDGHERASEFNRINQRGPRVMGWRSNALNQNLNRDYTKLDTKEIQAILGLINREKPSLYMDIHVTDGADYQYDITYGTMGAHAYSPAISTWLTTQFRSQIDKALTQNGHLPGPLLFAVNDEDFKDGNNEYTFSPRFSHAYGDARHLPSILVENHSLKPFRQRVLGTVVLLEETLQLLSKEGSALNAAIRKDEQQLKETITLTWDFPKTSNDSMQFAGIASRKIQSEITGGSYVQWLGKPETQHIVVRKNNLPLSSVNRPLYYVIPVQYAEVIERIKLHGLHYSTLKNDSSIQVEMYHLSNPQQQGKLPLQGRFRVKADITKKIKSQVFPAGSLMISTQQALGDLAVLLFEPESTDSYFQWGFFAGCLERTEYFETYVIEPYAAEQLAKNPAVKKAFEEKKKLDEAFAKDQQAQLRWFYEQSPYADATYLVYPVGRIVK
ncbi:MAG: hypothetical protein RLZZ543_439 [Bacteroidota bacterium]|jgi:hypothetical protein